VGYKCLNSTFTWYTLLQQSIIYTYAGGITVQHTLTQKCTVKGSHRFLLFIVPKNLCFRTNVRYFDHFCFLSQRRSSDKSERKSVKSQASIRLNRIDFRLYDFTTFDKKSDPLDRFFHIQYMIFLVPVSVVTILTEVDH
jgi:hypothetical protein